MNGMKGQAVKAKKDNDQQRVRCCLKLLYARPRDNMGRHSYLKIGEVV